MARGKMAVAMAVVLTLGAVGFLVGRFVVGGDTGTQARNPSAGQQLDDLKTQEAQKRQEPRFAGKLLGIYLAPSLDQLPREVWEGDNRLSSGGCAPIPVEQASTLDFTRPLAMPPGYVLSEQDPANTGSNPGALTCSGRLRSVGWGYTATGAGGIPGTVTIVRVTTTYDTQDVAKSQVSTQAIGGREAVVVRPALSGGLGQRYLVYFPEPFGKTSIETFNLSEDAAIKVAEAVAEAS